MGILLSRDSNTHSLRTTGYLYVWRLRNYGFIIGEKSKVYVSVAANCRLARAYCGALPAQLSAERLHKNRNEIVPKALADSASHARQSKVSKVARNAGRGRSAKESSNIGTSGLPSLSYMAANVSAPDARLRTKSIYSLITKTTTDTKNESHYQPRFEEGVFTSLF